MSRKTSYYDEFSVTSISENRKRYTVQRRDSSVSDRSSNTENDQFFNIFFCVLKWLTATFLFLAVLFCVVTSKICLLVLGQQFKKVNQTRVNATREYSAETSKMALVLMLLLALIIPQAMSLIYASWTSLRRKSRPWPTKKGFILILIGGFLETISLCFITIVTLTVLPVDPDSVVLLMCSLAVVPSIWQVTKSRLQWSTVSGKLGAIKFTTSAIIAMIGVLLLSLKIPDISGKIGIPVAIVLLSIAWSPKFRKLQIQCKQQETRHFDETMSRGSVSDVSSYIDDIEQGPPLSKSTARGKAAIISSLWKLLLTPLVTLTFTKIYSIADLDNISSGFSAINVSNPSFVYFMLHVFASFFGYHLGWLACSLCLQRVGYALPLTLATPTAIFMTHVTGICETDAIPLPCSSQDHAYTLLAGALLWLSQLLATTYYVWKSQGRIMAKAYDLFWIPSYNGVCLEQYLLLNRRNQASDEEQITQQRLISDINVFICTTMYHEEDYEMEQLLRSIHDVDINKEKSSYHFESHVFFDGCVRADVLNDYVLQLASLVEKTLNVHFSECTKMKTPYGMQLKWRLPGGMDFTIHLKDNAKVKNKKRWSQVMYMSYVLDFKEQLLGVQDEQSFILTTDADVKFTYDSVEALIDQIVEDPRVGAVCARTHPLGSGPVVWYQIFDYAIGHWFQKVANHMLGSVLCSPGCFSLYRCQAVRDVLPTYATGVDHAFEFLTKDMGEDRWMCTLMVQRGWRLTYCAAAVDSTYCPESFDEFYKQRRRWTPSTLANLVLLVSEWRRILKNNEHISFPFIIYQTFLVCSTVIGPSTVILVIVGGMIFSGININEITTIVLISLVVVAYVIVCLFTPQNVQLKVSKLLTFVFAVIMCIVVIGVAVQISNEIKERKVEPTSAPTLEPNTTASTLATSLEHHLPAGVSTMYLAGLSGIFLAAALLHPNEFMCLLHGIWYILCLPSGYLLLTIYSLCNLTDRSWGTREGKSSVSEAGDWYKPVLNCLKKTCKCCQEEPDQLTVNKRAKRGSIVESKTSIKAEVANSYSKQRTGPKDTSENTETSFTTKGEVLIKTETTEVLCLPPVPEESVESNKMEGESPAKKNAKLARDNAPNGSAKHTSTAVDDDEDQTCELPKIVVNSDHEIPSERVDDFQPREMELNGSLILSPGEDVVRHKMSSDESCESAITSNKQHLQQSSHPDEAYLDKDMENNNLQSHCYYEPPEQTTSTPEKSVNTFLVTTTIADSMNKSGEVHENTDFTSSTGNHLSRSADKANLYRPESEERPSSLQAGTPSPVVPGTVPRKISASQHVNQRNIPNQNQQGFPLTVSRLVSSSASMLVDNTDEQCRDHEGEMVNHSRSSFTFGSSLSIQTLDENNRPATALNNEVSYSDLNLPVEDWLSKPFKRYAPNFRKHGYDAASFLPGMTDKDLQMIGINVRGHRQRLLRHIRRIPRVDIEENIPENVENWLEEQGLGEYWPKFETSGYTEPNDLEDLKNMSKENIKETFNIHKQGHFNRLLSAIRKLQYPNQGQIKIRQTRRELDRLPLFYLDVDNSDEGMEYKFWDGLRQTCLIPELSAFDQTSKLKEKLVELRNTTLLVFGITNALWMIIILILVQHKDLKVLGVDIIGLGFLTVYGFIFTVQFFALLGHRFKTVVHILARTPWKVRTNRVSPSESVGGQPTP